MGGVFEQTKTVLPKYIIHRFKDPGDTVHGHSDSASMRELAGILEWLS